MHIPTDNQGLDHQDIALLRVLDRFETTSTLLLPELDNVQLGKGPFKHHVDNRGWVGGLKFSIFVQD